MFEFSSDRKYPAAAAFIQTVPNRALEIHVHVPRRSSRERAWFRSLAAIVTRQQNQNKLKSDFQK